MTIISQRADELADEIRRHRDLYYNDQPELSDTDFDLLEDELRDLDSNHPALSEVGAVPKYGTVVTHPSPMGSLDKEKTPEDIIAWLNKYRDDDTILVGSPKIDGCAIRLNYENGKLVEAATRGEGLTGQDVTANARMVRTIPNTLSEPITCEVRGEVYMRKDVLETLNEDRRSNGQREFANPRNTASGAMKHKNPAITESRNLDFLAYWYREEDAHPKTEMEAQYRCEVLGFEFAKLEIVESEHLEAFLLEWTTKRRSALDFVIDGVVLSLASFEQQEEAGMNGHNPRGKVVWKFPPVQEESVALDVEWQVGRTGKLTPVLKMEPVHIDGSTVSSPTLHSVQRFEELALGPGVRVLVEKAGDIIPQVVKVTWRPLDGGSFNAPTHCPECGEAVVRDGAHLMCVDFACTGQKERRIHHWLNTVDVKGAGPSIVTKLCSKVHEPSGIYYLTQSDLEELIGSDKIAETLWREFARTSKMPFWRMLAGLGIPSLGRTASKAIAKKYGTVDTLVAEISEEGVTAIEGLGDKTANQIVKGIWAMSWEIQRLDAVLEIEAPVTGGNLTGKTFCLTGSMSRGRKEIAADIEAAGGEVKSSVGKGLTYLVQSDPTSSSSKTKKAEKYGTEVISEEHLMEMIG